MPRMTLPGTPEGFEEETSAIKRRRLQLEALLAEPKLPGLAGGIANFALGLTRGYQEDKLDEQERDIAQRKAEYAKDWMNRIPVDRPAQAEVVGTGPLAPPPGTPGVEPSAAGPDTPAIWDDPKGMSMVPRGAEFTPNRKATPFVPRSVADVAKWAQAGAGLGPFEAALGASEVKDAREAPVRREEKQLAREATLAEQMRRNDDRIADNKRQELALQETVRNNKSNEAIRTQAQQALEENQRESRRLQAESNDIRRTAVSDAAAARGEKKTEQEKVIVRQTEKLGTQLSHEKIAPLDVLLSDVEKELKQYEDPKAPGKYKDIPGVGIYDSKKPEFLLDAKELAMRRKIEPLRHLITVSGAGLSQTEAEMKAVLQQDLGLGSFSPDASFAQAIPTLRRILEARKNAIHSSFEPEAVDTYYKRLNKGGSPDAPKLVDKLPMDVPVGTRAKDPATGKVLKFNGTTWE